MRYGLIWQSMASSARRVSAVSDRRSKALHEDQANLPVLARFALHGLVAQLRSIEVDIEKIEAEILKWHRTNETSRRLATIPGIGPITAIALAASVPDASLFRSGRQFAAWLGLTPKSHSSCRAVAKDETGFRGESRGSGCR